MKRVIIFAAVLVFVGGLFSFGSSSVRGTEEQPPCTVIVQPGESIQAAIDAAPEGAVICLAKGEWEENIKIRKSLTLRGQSPEQTVIRAKAWGQPVVRISSSEEIHVVIEKLTVTGAKGQPDGHGIIVEGSAHATITGCTVSKNERDGIELRDSAQTSITGCTVSGNGYGIWLRDSAQATISGNVIEGNSGYGILSWSTGEVRGEENRLRDNGVDLGGNLPGTLRLPLVEATEVEILFPDERYPTLQHAVDALLPGGRLSLQKGEYTASLTITKELTVAAQEGAEVTLRARKEETPVLSLVGGAKLSARGLKVIGGWQGLLLGADAQATITGCTVSGNGYGIWLWGSSQATITGCSVSGNGFDGIELVDLAQATITQTTVSKNFVGIQLWGLAQATITGCTVSENRWNGIVLSGSAQATITESTVSGNEEDGVGLYELAQAAISGCTVSGNTWDGIELVDSAQATITGSTLSENGRDGIRLLGSGQATISGCTVSGNWYGIRLGNLAQATIEGNKIFGNKGYGVVLWERPCFDIDWKFEGYLTGRANTIPGPDEPEGNKGGAVCPDDLSFLATEEGGELDRREK